MDRVLAPLEPRSPYPASMDGQLPVEQYSVLDPFVALTLAATATERIRLGTSVLVAPWYSPLLLARTLTAIDLASNGRLSVGLGLGWSVDEYDAVCAPLDHRGGRLDEMIDVLEAIWADGVTHVDGERYEIAAVGDPAEAGAAATAADPARRVHAVGARSGCTASRRVDPRRAADRGHRADVRRRP